MPHRNSFPLLLTIIPRGIHSFGLIEKDADDNKFVDCAIAADAEYIVTNDTHFNVLKEIDWPKVLVKTIEEFASLTIHD